MMKEQLDINMKKIYIKNGYIDVLIKEIYIYDICISI